MLLPLTALHVVGGVGLAAAPFLFPGSLKLVLIAHYGVALAYLAFGGCVMTIAENRELGLTGAPSYMHPAFCLAEAWMRPSTVRALLCAGWAASLAYAAFIDRSSGALRPSCAVCACAWLCAPLIALYAWVAVQSAMQSRERQLLDERYCSAVRAGGNRSGGDVFVDRDQSTAW